MTVANVRITQVLLKRGNIGRSSGYVGPLSELTHDTTLDTLRIHDGATPGGTIIATHAEVQALANVVANVSVGNVNLTGYATVTYVDNSIANVTATANTGNITFSGNTISTLNEGNDIFLAPQGDVILSSNRNMIFDMNAFSGQGIVLQDSTEDGYDDPETPSTLYVGRIYHDTGTMVIQSDGRIEQANDPGNLSPAYGSLRLSNQDNSASITISPPSAEFYEFPSEVAITGNLRIEEGYLVKSSSNLNLTADTMTWSFDINGGMTFPNEHYIGTGEGNMEIASPGGVRVARLNANTDVTSYLSVSHGSISLYPRSEDLSTQSEFYFTSTGNLYLPTNMDFGSSPAVATSGIVFADGTYQHTAAVPEADTIDSVTTRGNTTLNSITVGSATADYFQVDLSPTSAPVVTTGMIAWNSATSTFDMGLTNGIVLQAGQELHMYVKAYENISNGQAVMFAGANGENILVRKYDPTVAGFMLEWFVGVATQNLITNEFGYVTVFGIVHDIDTNAYNLGDILYADNTVVGALTTAAPAPGSPHIIVAAVTKKSGTGHIMVRPNMRPFLYDLPDVNISTPTVGQVLKFNGNYWTNDNGYANVNVAEYLTSQNISTQLQSDWTETNAGNVAYIKNKPNLTVYATQTDLSTAINNLINSAPNTLDTLGEIAANLATEGNAVSSIINSITSTNSNVSSLSSNVTSYQLYANANAAAQQSSITTLQSQVYANANVAAYMPVYGGAISASNITLTGNIIGNTGGFAIGYRDIPQIAFTSNTTISTTDAGKHYYSTVSTNTTLTVPPHTSQDFAVGAAVNIINQGTGNIVITQGVGVTVYLAGNATASNRTLSSYGMATLQKVATDTWFLVGVGLS